MAAPTRINVLDIAGPYRKESETPQLSTITFTAADATNGNMINMPSERGVLVLFNNTDVGAQTVSVASSPDPHGRTADITDFSIAAGATVGRMFRPVGWEQSLGGRDLHIEASDAGVEIAAIPL